MTILTATHCEDPDGRHSEALLFRHLNLSGELDLANHIPVRYDRLLEAFEKLNLRVKEVDHPQVYVADVNVNPELIQTRSNGKSLLDDIVNHSDSFTWIDHHDGTLRNRSYLEDLGIQTFHDKKFSAAPIILREFFTNPNDYEKKLAKIAQAHDHKKDGRTSSNVIAGDNLEKVIALANSTLDYGTLFEISVALRDKKIFDGKYQLKGIWKDLADEFDLKKEPAFRDLLGTVTVRDVCGYKVAFAYSSALLSQKPGSRFLRESMQNSADIFVCMYGSPLRNKVMSANKNVNFPIVPFVESLGGGGRDNKGGFTSSYSLQKNQYLVEVGRLVRSMERFYYDNLK